MTTQTRPMMSLTVGMPVSIRIRKNTPPAAPPYPKCRKSNFRPAERPDLCISQNCSNPCSRSYTIRTGTGYWLNFLRTHKINV